MTDIRDRVKEFMGKHNEEFPAKKVGVVKTTQGSEIKHHLSVLACSLVVHNRSGQPTREKSYNTDFDIQFIV